MHPTGICMFCLGFACVWAGFSGAESLSSPGAALGWVSCSTAPARRGPGNHGAWTGCRGFPGSCCAWGTAGCPSTGGTAPVQGPQHHPRTPKAAIQPQTPPDPPGTGGSTACPAVGRKRVFLRRGKVMARSGSCQHGRRPESTQMPLQPFYFR